MTYVLLWDIDGTLLTTNRAGIFAWEEATRQVTGTPVDLATFRSAGRTDVEIGAAILEMTSHPPDGQALEQLLRLYQQILPEHLHRREGRVLPGVREVLKHLKGCSDVESFLLTGNLRACAAAKLSHYGLDEYLQDGAFAEDGQDRASVARCAMGLVAEKLGRLPPLEHIFVIGDTPHDIHCGQAIGARTIALATGPYQLAELEVLQPWRAFAQLPAPGVFLDLLAASGQEGSVVNLAPDGMDAPEGRATR